MKTRKGYVAKLVLWTYPHHITNVYGNWRVFKTPAAARKAAEMERISYDEKVIVMKYTRVYG